jgi:hypothetical protein
MMRPMVLSLVALVALALAPCWTPVADRVLASPDRPSDRLPLRVPRDSTG